MQTCATLDSGALRAATSCTRLRMSASDNAEFASAGNADKTVYLFEASVTVTSARSLYVRK